MKQLKYFLASGFVVLTALSCQKTINEDKPHREKDLLEIKLKGQMGTAVMERDSDSGTATIFILARADYPYAEVEVEGIVVSAYASPSVTKGGKLNFSNPERRAKITVTSEAGGSLDWWIYLKAYDPFYVGEWKIEDVKLHCDQKISNSGDGSWDTQWWNGDATNGNQEFGTSGMAEYDNVITITLDEGEVVNNQLTGTITNAAGADGQYGDFYGIMTPYSVTEPLDMNPRLRYLLPPGEAVWALDLTTQEMKITKDNVTSTLIFADDGPNKRFRFILPFAGDGPARDNFYNNMWRSSTELFYVMRKVQ